MLAKPIKYKDSDCPQALNNILNPKHPLYQLSKSIPWDDLEGKLQKYYSTKGRPAKPIRLMVGLHILKYLYDISDEQVCKSWQENGYWQYLTGKDKFQRYPPCNPSEMTHFRNRIG